MEACTSTTSSHKSKSKYRKTDGPRAPRSEFEIINEKIRCIHTPLMELKPIKCEGKFLNRFRLYVGNISNSVTKEDLESIFKVYGEINDIFIQHNKNFAFVKMDYYHNALKAKQELNGSVLKERKIYITFSPQASILVKHLSPSVTNELLHVAFSVFGEVEYAFIITEKRGKSIGEGVVDFVKKHSAAAAKKYCTERMFFITSSLKPITVEDYVPPPDMEGISEEMIRKTHSLYEERQMGPRFAIPGSFEYEYAQRYKDLWQSYNIKLNMLQAEQESEERKLEIDLMRAKYDYETERLKNMIREREMEKERYCQKLEAQGRYRVESPLEDPAIIDFKPPENLFTQATHLNDILDSEERKIKEQQWRMEEFRSDYDMSDYQDKNYFEHNSNKRKVPEVTAHSQKRTRYSK